MIFQTRNWSFDWRNMEAWIFATMLVSALICLGLLGTFIYALPVWSGLRGLVHPDYGDESPTELQYREFISKLLLFVMVIAVVASAGYVVVAIQSLAVEQPITEREGALTLFMGVAVIISSLTVGALAIRWYKSSREFLRSTRSKTSRH